jgi:hypothetical protein
MNLLKRLWQNRWVRWIAWTGISLVTIYALFSTWVNWSGARAWSATLAMLKAEGETVVFRETTVAPIPDAENFCAIPLLKDLPLATDKPDSTDVPSKNKSRLESLKLPSTSPTGTERPRSTNAVLGKAVPLQEWATWMRTQGAFQFSPDAGKPAQEILDALVAQDAAVIQELADGLPRPFAQWLPSWRTREYANGMLMAVMFPHYSSMHGLIPRLTLRTAAAAQAGDVTKAHESTLLIARLGQACMNDPFLIGLLIGISNGTYLHSATWELCWAQVGSIQDFTKLETVLSELDYQRATLQAFRSELAAMTETLRHCKTSREQRLGLVQIMKSEGNSSGDVISNAISSGIPDGFFDSSAAVLADREFRYMIKPLRDGGWAAARKGAEDFEKEILEMSKRGPWMAPSYIMTTITAPVVSGVVYRAAYAQALLNQAVIACALERHRLASGTYPDSLDSVNLASGKPLPPDPMTGKPMRYRKAENGRYVLWSIGVDAKDDEGKWLPGQQTPNNSSKFYEPTFRGDWIWAFPGE